MSLTTLEMPAETLTGDSYSNSNPPIENSNPIADEAAAMVGGGEDEGGDDPIVNGWDHRIKEGDDAAAIPPGGGSGEAPAAADAPANPSDGSTSPHEPPPLKHGMATVEDEVVKDDSPGPLINDPLTTGWSKAAAELLAKRSWKEKLIEVKDAFIECAMLRKKLQDDLKAAREIEKEAMEEVQRAIDLGWQPFMRSEGTGEVAATDDSASGGDVDSPHGLLPPSDGGDAPTLAELFTAPLDPDAWRYASIDELGLEGKFIDKLKDAGAGTMGGLEDLRTEIAAGRGKWPQGVGPKKIEAITEKLLTWLGEHRDGAEFQQRTVDPTLAEGSEATGSDDATATTTITELDSPLLSDDPEEAARIAQILKRAEEIEWEFPADGSGPNKLGPTGKKFKGHFEDGERVCREEGSLADCTWTAGDEQDSWLRGFIAESRKDGLTAVQANRAATEIKPDEPAKTAKEKPATKKKPAAAVVVVASEDVDVSEL